MDPSFSFFRFMVGINFLGNFHHYQRQLNSRQGKIQSCVGMGFYHRDNVFPVPLDEKICLDNVSRFFTGSRIFIQRHQTRQKKISVKISSLFNFYHHIFCRR